MIKLILYNHKVKKIINKIWKSELLNKSRLYRRILRKQISREINEYRDKPKCVRIENTNICNANCIICPRDRMTREQGIMSSTLCGSIIEQCIKYGVNDINLHNFGEPLLDKGLSEKISFAKRSGIKRISTNTNASLLNPEISAQLMESRLDELFVSIDACSKDTFEAVRKGLNYGIVIENLMNFISLKKKLKAHTKLIVSFVLTPKNISESDNFVLFWKGKADYVSISYAHDWAGAGKDALKNSRLNYPCRLPFSELVIGWNGDYILCCADFDAKARLGNFNDFDIIRAWKENAVLDMYRKAQLTDYGFSISPCKECTLNTIWWF